MAEPAIYQKHAHQQYLANIVCVLCSLRHLHDRDSQAWLLSLRPKSKECSRNSAAYSFVGHLLLQEQLEADTYQNREETSPKRGHKNNVCCTRAFCGVPSLCFYLSHRVQCRFITLVFSIMLPQCPMSKMLHKCILNITHLQGRSFCVDNSTVCFHHWCFEKLKNSTLIMIIRRNIYILWCNCFS